MEGEATLRRLLGKETRLVMSLEPAIGVLMNRFRSTSMIRYGSVGVADRGDSFGIERNT